MNLELIPLVTLEVLLGDVRFVGNGALGTRAVAEVQSIRSTGGRLDVRNVGMAMADWVIIGPTGILNPDVRLTLESHDGALIYVHYVGRAAALGQPVYVAPVFETGDERYAWLNSILAVGKGDMVGNVITYEWYEVR